MHKPRAEDILFYGSIGLHYTGDASSHIPGKPSSPSIETAVEAFAAKEVHLVLSSVGITEMRSSALNSNTSTNGFAQSKYQRSKGTPLLLWRDVTAQHFDNRGGHYKHRGAGYDYNLRTAEASPCTNHSLIEMRRYQLWNRYATPRLTSAGVMVMRTWDSSAVQTWDAHVAYGDCTHWCQPGVPNSWARMFAAILTSHS
mgnify:CR=1 FL=1